MCVCMGVFILRGRCVSVHMYVSEYLILWLDGCNLCVCEFVCECVCVFICVYLSGECMCACVNVYT